MNSEEIRRLHSEYLMPCCVHYYAEPIVFSHGQGLWLYDLEGREYLDFFGGILTVSLGHCEPSVTEALRTQVGRLVHTSALYPNEAIVRLARRLAEITPGALGKSFFMSSGTEADEFAVLIAKLYTGRQEVIALRHSYSGRSALAVSMMGNKNYRPIPSQIPGIVHAHPAYCYRCALGLTYPSCDLRCARDLEELILTTTTGAPAAFIAEPIQGVGGFVVPPPEYFEVAVGIVRKYGGLFISDEVQTGFGRTGRKWFGIEHWGVEPDIMTFAKGLANGTPIGVTITTDQIAQCTRGIGTISTFGGNPISTTAALATLEVMTEKQIPEHAEIMGQRLRAHLEDLQDRQEIVGDVRGLGLMQALELVESRASRAPAPARTVRFMEACKSRGLLVGRGGLYGNVIRIAPPMLVGADEIDRAAQIMVEAMDEAAR
jgi:4-aminobutyrate aminotransferase-like enzyme